MSNPTERKLATGEHRLIHEIKRQTGQLAAINAVTKAVSQSLDLGVTLQTALEAVLSVIPVEASGISLIDETAGDLVLRAQRGWKQDFVTRPMRIKLGQGLSGQAIREDRVIITGDLSNDPRLAVPAIRQEEVKAMVLAPMHARGKVVGILSVMSFQPYLFDDDEVSVLRAIADQVGIALDNARLYESVRAQQSRLEAVLQSTADAIIATDSHGNVNLINHAAEAMFELEDLIEALLGRPLRDAPLPEVIAKKLREAMSRDENGQETAAGQSFEVSLSNGRCLAGVVSPVFSQTRLDEQQTDGWVVVFQDITHVKEAERTRLQFIQTAAHDLRNPLGVTLSALTMLNKNWKDPTETDKEVFNIAMRGLNRMQDLIDDLLNLERITSGVDFRHDPIQIPELIERATMDMGPVLQRKDQTLKLAVDTSLPVFYGDERWLYRAITNFVSNAHKYTPQGSTITVRAEAAGSELVIQVEDNGPGIPLDAQSRLFERFYRVNRPEDRKEKIQGTGLGLAIVKSIAEKHNGRVFVESEPGQGSIFGMVMPFTSPSDVK